MLVSGNTENGTMVKGFSPGQPGLEQGITSIHSRLVQIESICR